MPDLLVEIGTEEIPAGYLAPASGAFAEMMTDALDAERLSGGGSRTFHTPRRITLAILALPESQDDFSEEVQGPSKKIAFDDDGKPTRAGAGFARGQGIAVEELQVKETKNGPYVFAHKKTTGRPTAEVLADILPGVIAKLPFPKSMHWDDMNFTFARPIRSILALLDSDVVGFEAGGVTSGRVTHGHPFLAPRAIEIADADVDKYLDLLRQANVIADVEERREMTREQIEKLLSAHGAELTELELLDEVTNLVEFPTAIEGSFPEHFLEVPSQVIEAAMMEHQRYFPVRDASGELVNRFITVSNRTGESSDLIRQGNERVLDARLNDAQFFWTEDRRHSLEEHHESLSGVTFQEKLGTYADRVARIRELALFIAKEMGLDDKTSAKVERAAVLCKADLVTQMVGEFPSLQGVIGREYARADGEETEVVEAIAEHYQPRSARDDLPQTDVGRILALADKFDALVGCFAAGLIPTGSQDPYALRRQTGGIIRIIITGELRLSIDGIIDKARKLLPDGLEQAGEASRNVSAFVQDRLYYYFLDAGYSHDIIRAALKPGFTDLLDLSRRLASLQELAGTHDWHKLVTAVERTHNITKDFIISGEVDEALLGEPEERDLYQLYVDNHDKMHDLIEKHDYNQVCRMYEEAFAVPLHVFFENVFVNVDDENVRNNRLTLLKQINLLFAEKVADLSQILIEDR